MEFIFSDLLGAIVNFGGDPVLIEDVESAEGVLVSIERSTSYRVLADGEEFNVAKRQLDLVDFQVNRIFSFVDGSEFLVCFSVDWR